MLKTPWINGIREYATTQGTRYKIRVKFWVECDRTWKVKEQHGFRTKRQAEYARDKIRNARFEERKFPERTTSRLTVQDAMESWLHHYAGTHCKYSTRLSYRQTLTKYIYPRLGSLSLFEVTPASVASIFVELQSMGLAKQTIKNIFIPLREAYGHFLGRYPDRFTGNPMQALKPFFKTIKGTRKPIRPLSKTQIAALLDSAKKDGPLAYLIILLAVRTGLRRGELLGLNWPDLDLKKGTACILRAIVRGKETTPKNHQRRTVDLSPQLVHALESWAPDTRTPAVLHHHQRRISAAYINVMFKRIATDTQLAGVRFHDLRHTYASQLIDLGANPKYIQSQLGHSTINVTFDIYGHLLDQSHNEIVAGLDG